MKKNQKIFLLWLVLVITWNFAVPGAKPIYDVVAAVILSLFSNFRIIIDKYPLICFNSIFKVWSDSESLSEFSIIDIEVSIFSVIFLM